MEGSDINNAVKSLLMTFPRGKRNRVSSQDFQVYWFCSVRAELLERPTLASRVPLFSLGHFPTNECEISDFCL